MQTRISTLTAAVLLLTGLLITGLATVAAQNQTRLAKQARVTGQKAAKFIGGNPLEVCLARDDGSQHPVLGSSLTIPAGRSRIFVGSVNVYDGKYDVIPFGGLSVQSLPAPKNLRHVAFDAKGGHEYFVSAKYRMFTSYKNAPITVTDKTTGQIVYTTPNPAY